MGPGAAPVGGEVFTISARPDIRFARFGLQHHRVDAVVDPQVAQLARQRVATDHRVVACVTQNQVIVDTAIEEIVAVAASGQSKGEARRLISQGGFRINGQQISDPAAAPPALVGDVMDNRIIAVAHALLEAGERVVFVSKDINARIKSDALGIHAEDFENQKVDLEYLYTGYETLTTNGALIDSR